MYNEETDIKETVLRCLAQKTDDFEFEILLIDDGSTDNTLKLCKEMFSKEQRIHIINESVNKGVSHARNLGGFASTGDILIFLNADELIEPDFLIQLHKHYYTASADYVFPQTRVANRNTLYGLYRDCYRLTKYHRPNLFMWSQGFSCRKKLFEDVNGFSESYSGCGGEDWDFVSRLDYLHKNRVVDTDIVVKHTVPQGFQNVLWHMYNRGRGTAYYDLIYRKKSLAQIILIFLLSSVLLICIMFWDYDVVIVFILAQMIRLVREGWAISKRSENKRIPIIFMHLLNCIIRAIGYHAILFKQCKEGKK